MQTQSATFAHTAIKHASLHQWRTVHLIGICGSGMKALAEYLNARGCHITGSDLHVTSKLKSYFQRHGIAVYDGHQTNHVPKSLDLVVHSAAVPVDNPELHQAKAYQHPILSYSEVLGMLMDESIGIAIAGTHGKSTTTAMVTAILQSAGLNPSKIMGADDLSSETSGQFGAGPHLILESCEYNQSFLQLKPHYAAITNVEADHFDCYRNFGELKNTFLQFLGQVETTGSIVLPADFSNSCCADFSANITTFSADPGMHADWSLGTVKEMLIDENRWQNIFTVKYHNQDWLEVTLQLPGSHNRMNALAAIAVAHQLGISAENIQTGLAKFRGIKRRFQFRGIYGGMTFIDDYAHHPTAIRETIQTARKLFENRMIWCLYEPHQISRTNALFDDYVTSLLLADRVCVLPVFAAREQEDLQITELARQLANTLAAKGRSACYCDTLDVARVNLEDEGRAGDIVITMGAGRIDRLYHEYTGTV